MSEAQFCGQGNRLINNVCYRLTKVSEICPINEEYSQITQKCECKNNFSRDGLRNICVPGCSGNLTFDFNTLQCVCP